jgi:hypothetical protein
MKAGNMDLRIIQRKTQLIGHMTDSNSINTTVITSSNTLAIAPESCVISGGPGHELF